jgi:hypothetical protein
MELVTEKLNNKIIVQSLQPIKDNQSRILGYVLCLHKINRSRKKEYGID